MSLQTIFGIISSNSKSNAIVKVVEDWDVIWDFLDTQPWSDSSVPNDWSLSFTPDAGNYMEEDATYGLHFVSDGTNIHITSNNVINASGEYEAYLYIPDHISGTWVLQQSGNLATLQRIGHYTFPFTSTEQYMRLKRGTAVSSYMEFLKVRSKSFINNTPAWTVPATPDYILGQDFRTFPNRKYGHFSTINWQWLVHAPYPWLSIEDSGLVCKYDPDLDVSDYAGWEQVRAEISPAAQGTYTDGDTSIHDIEFTIDVFPASLSATCGFFQMFHDTLDRPELNVFAAFTGQFGGIDTNTIVAKVEGESYVTTNDPWLIGHKYHLRIAIEHTDPGEYKIILDDTIITSGTTGDLDPDTNLTIGKFPLYNAGGNASDMQVTVHRMALHKYDVGNKPNFSLIT